MGIGAQRLLLPGRGDPKCRMRSAWHLNPDRFTPTLGHTPSTAGTFRRKFQKSPESLNQKNPRVRKIRVRNSEFSGAGNGCANFMDTWKNAFFLQEKPMSVKFPFLGGGVLGGGGGVPILFLWARGFF